MQTRESEATLVERARLGDADALGALFDLHGLSVYRVAYRLLRSREDAEDTVQDVFGGLRLALAKYSETGSFGPWLRRVAARTALMKRRSNLRRATPIAPPSLGTDGDPALRMTLDAAMGALPERLRDVFVLRVVEGYSHDEIASLLDISESASKVRLHRAIKQLKTSLQESL